jgi:antitoxin component of MazEF toxin-antitoxin module
MARRKADGIPTDMSRRIDICEETPLKVVEHEGRFEEIPMTLVPTTGDSSKALAGMFEKVTAENLHCEVDSGSAVGRESW